MKRDFSLAGTLLSPPWHSGVDHWSAISEACDVKTGKQVLCEAVLCIYVTKTLMPLKFPLLNCVAEIMIGFVFHQGSFLTLLNEYMSIG